MNQYLLFKTLHIIAMVCWMAGMFYLPRLYAYHTKVKRGSETDTMFQTMERKLLRVIINPSMILTFVFGFCLIYATGGWQSIGKWFHVKLLVVLLLTGVHGYLAKVRKIFVAGNNTRTFKYYAMINEIPSVLLVIIVTLAVFKPF